MGIKVLINETAIDATGFKQTIVTDEVTNQKLQKVIFDFKVTSNMYHDMTVLLYGNDFAVKVPEENLTFHATILNYSTSITDLYQENEVGDFHLELIEKVS